MTSSAPVARPAALPPRRRRPGLLVLLPVIVLAAWLAYLWFISGVLPSVEKYPNGNLKWVGYVKRVSLGTYARHGHWATYHENGQLASEGSYEAGRKVGMWAYRDSDGSPILQTTNTADDESGARFNSRGWGPR